MCGNCEYFFKEDNEYHPQVLLNDYFYEYEEYVKYVKY